MTPAPAVPLLPHSDASALEMYWDVDPDWWWDWIEPDYSDVEDQ